VEKYRGFRQHGEDYVLIDDCYVHGIMEGEVIRTGNIPVQDLVWKWNGMGSRTDSMVPASSHHLRIETNTADVLESRTFTYQLTIRAGLGI